MTKLSTHASKGILGALPRVRRPALNPARIVRAAIDLMDRHGVAGLSMRKLGAVLGVEAMSLYGYFPSKAALLTAARAAMFDELEDGSVGETDGFERLRTVMRATYRLMEKHPGAVDLLLVESADPALLRRRDADLETMLSIGMNRDDAMYALHSLVAFVMGSLRQAELLSAAHRNAAFEFGLGLLLDGLRRKVRDPAG